MLGKSGQRRQELKKMMTAIYWVRQIVPAQKRIRINWLNPKVKRTCTQ